MEIREELFSHPDWWKTRQLMDLNETREEFHNRVNYLRWIEPNPLAIKETGIGDDEKLDYETIDEYRARIRNDYMLVDTDCNEKSQDGYYMDEENVKKDMLGAELPFNKEWYLNYLNKTESQ
ncbi:MAG: hypothetical protein V4565_14685 [Bacteroidota bacterium]